MGRHEDKEKRKQAVYDYIRAGQNKEEDESAGGAATPRMKDGQAFPGLQDEPLDTSPDNMAGGVSTPLAAKPSITPPPIVSDEKDDPIDTRPILGKEKSKKEAKDLVEKGLKEAKSLDGFEPNEEQKGKLIDSVEAKGDSASTRDKWLYIAEGLHTMATAAGTARGGNYKTDMFKQMRADGKNKSREDEWVFKMDSNGRPVKMNKRTGEIITGKGPKRGPRAPAGPDSPPERRDGENKEQYKARLQVWTAQQREKDRPMTEGQGKAAGQMIKMQGASKATGNDYRISAKGWDDMDTQAAQNEYWDTAPGRALEATGVTRRDKESEILDEKDQQKMAARRAWADAYVRSTSGAVVGERELSSEEFGDKSAGAMDTYMPQRGDSEATIKRKRQMREDAEKSVMVRTKPGTVDVEETTPTPTPAPQAETYVVREINGVKYKFDPKTKKNLGAL